MFLSSFKTYSFFGVMLYIGIGRSYALLDRTLCVLSFGEFFFFYGRMIVLFVSLCYII
jgi:hypothetical protein